MELCIILFILSFNLLIGWQLSIWNCFKPFFALMYNCQLLCFWLLALKYCSRDLPTAPFPDIAPSRMFTAISLCLIIRPTHKWHLFFKVFKTNLSFHHINPLTPNDHYSGRTAPLTSRRCILNIHPTNIRTEYFKHAA
jgi:hypothetical protein